MSLPAAKMERAGLGKGGIDWKAPHQGVVEPSSECDRRLVRDLELHAYYR